MAIDNPTTITGRQLYGMLPEVYRTRDSAEAGGEGDLARYLDACGELLDRIRATLDQRLADSFPDNPSKGRSCQPWLIPYFAQLLDVRLVSPDDRGRRDEVANAVAWRQRKGTLTAIEQIAEAVGRIEVEIQEGWRRCAVTPRIAMSLLPAGALGEEPQLDDFRNHPLWAARHPDLPTATPDFRYPSRAVAVAVAAGAFPTNPIAKLTSFAGTPVWWRQLNRHGAPCFPGSYDDVSRRTIDLRTPHWRQGQIHPKRVILHAPPPLGFFQPGLFPVHTGDMLLDEEREHLLEDQIIDGTLRVTAGRVRLRRCAVRALEVTIPAGVMEEPVVDARDCLFDRMAVPGLARLEYCSVLTTCRCGYLQASDSLFAGELELKPGVMRTPHCVRFSRIPPGSLMAALLAHRNSSDRPVFHAFEFDEGGEVVRRAARFGEPGCAVLHPATPEAVRFGAEDGGEMGVHHGWRHSLLMAAVQDKLQEFLPVGVEAVIVPDLRLHRAPFPPCE